MFRKPFVVLDLETSGIDPKRDDIIEVAMVRYENGKEVKRYDDLIKIDYELPKIITVITGITDQDLRENGQDRKAVFKEIESALQGAYLIAHNIDFDAGFLKAKGIDLDVLGFIDTIPLAQILYSQAASYSLESLADDLDIKHVNKHRAMGDVEATLELFKKMCKKIETLPDKLLKDVEKYVSRSMWDGGAVFEGVKGKNITSENTVGGIRESRLQDNGIQKPLEVGDILGEGGVFQQYSDDYEPRSQQVQMAENVMNAFDQGYHLICEAPTGVGKSLAYLTAAANMAIKNKSKVVISTNTINLQEQLFEKDIPLLQELYRHATSHPGIHAALLKGRTHYLCLRRLAKFKERSRFSDTEIILLTKILVWQTTTLSDDCGEIHLTREENMIWDFELCADKKYCTPQKCKAYGECYLHRARKKAEQADIIVVNHALLCADLESEGALLPDYQYLVIDEAHNFESASTDAFGMSLKQENFILPLKLIESNLETVQKRYEGTLFGGQMAMDRIGDALENIDGLKDAIDNLFTVIALFVNQNVQDSGYIENLLVDQGILGSEEWLNLSTSSDETLRRINQWLRTVKDFVEAWMLSGDEASEQNEFIMEILQESEILQEQMTALNHFFADAGTSDYIRWMTSDLQGVVTVNLAPYLPGDYLKDRLYSQKKSIILTSATLGVKLSDKSFDAPEQHPFTYLRTILSLDDRFEELIIDSPFNFETQTYVLIPNDAIPITSPKSNQQLVPFFEQLIRNVGGNMMSLFTSYKMIETLYLNLMEPLQNEGVRLLAQRISGGRNKIMKAYLNDPAHSILFGTASFWEGVDIKGDALSTLVIHKLPFDVPSDPICKARSQMFNNGFFEYLVPRAILKFRQGFGRLIRSQKDYGVMIVLDNRVLTKEYGKLFLEALPERITLEESRLMEIPDKVKEWLGLNRK
ncbi:DEAD/DEAH box helicase family protein [Candidatus Peregrinibacteria bacterium]|nr:DEAD/DEAH box helicase family protein [Candidatus Peregrinibacteria bacterium]